MTEHELRCLFEATTSCTMFDKWPDTETPQWAGKYKSGAAELEWRIWKEAHRAICSCNPIV